MPFPAFLHTYEVPFRTPIIWISCILIRNKRHSTTMKTIGLPGFHVFKHGLAHEKFIMFLSDLSALATREKSS